MNKIYSIIKITRPTNLLIIFAVVIVSTIICSKNFEFAKVVFIGSIVAVLVGAAGNIINDIFDIEIDKINRPSRPLVSGSLSKTSAYILYFIFNLTSIFIAYQISLSIFAMVLLTTIMLYFYSFKFKSLPLIGNMFVALCTALAFIFGGMLVNNFKQAIIPALFAFLINFIREVIKDIEDIEGDKKNHISTFPVKYGITASKKVILFVSVILILTTIYPFTFHIYKIEYFLFVMFLVNLPLIYFLRELFKNEFINKISKYSLMLKVIMIFGLVAIFLGK